MSSYAEGLIVIFGALLVGVVMIGFIFTWMRSHRLRIRDPTRENSYITDYWVLEKADKETGSLYWSSVWFQPRLKLEKPPKAAIDIGKKGKKFAECFMLNAGNKEGVAEVCWIEDKGITEETILSVSKKKIADSFDPLSITSKSFAIGEFKKSQEKRNRKWDMQKVVSIATLGVFGMMFLMLLVFAPDIFKEMKGYRAQNMEILKSAADITNNQAVIMQSLGSKLGDLDVQIVQTPPDDNAGTVIQDGESPPEN